MNDGLYRHELNEDEQVVFAGFSGGAHWKASISSTWIAMFLVVPYAAKNLGDHSPQSGLTVFLTMVLVVWITVILCDGVLRHYIAKARLRPALVTNLRVIAPNGINIPLSRISRVHGRWSTVKLEGQKLADGLTIRDMQDARAFRTAIERQLA